MAPTLPPGMAEGGIGPVMEAWPPGHAKGRGPTAGRGIATGRVKGRDAPPLAEALSATRLGGTARRWARCCTPAADCAPAFGFAAEAR